MSSVSIFKNRIVKAIKHGNEEEKYIVEACNAMYSLYTFYDFHAAIEELKREGIIKYNENIEGYQLCNQ